MFDLFFKLFIIINKLLINKAISYNKICVIKCYLLFFIVITLKLKNCGRKLTEYVI